MLSNLTIKNVALIDNLTIDFGAGLNVISGETGAGKSIMLDSLGFVFGDRADRTLIRQNCTSMRVSATFADVPARIQSKIEHLGIEGSDDYLLDREYDINGKNVCRINGDVVSTQILKKVAGMLVDIQGQNEQQSILKREYQLEILDAFCQGELDQPKVVLGAYIDEIERIDADILALGGSSEQKQNLIDLYTYQVGEIESAGVQSGEYESLQAKKKEMANYEKLMTNMQSVLGEMNGSGFGAGVSEGLSNSAKLMSGIADYGEQYRALADRLQSVYLEARDIADNVADIVRSSSFDENEFERIDERLDYIKDLFRKYGGGYEQMSAYLVDTRRKLDDLVNSGERYAQLTAQRDALLNKVDAVQGEMTEIRRRYATSMGRAVCDRLATLGMKNAVFSVDFSSKGERYTRVGCDDVEFMFSANIGFDKKPLAKVISGGEMSRFMLAYKQVVNTVDDIHTMIFDEIDAGLSGAVAQTVAESLKDLSADKQVIAVSHLPQISMLADDNYMVSKCISDGSTFTRIERLTGDRLYGELARLMGMDPTKAENIAFVKNMRNG